MAPWLGSLPERATHDIMRSLHSLPPAPALPAVSCPSSVLSGPLAYYVVISIFFLSKNSYNMKLSTQQHLA